MMIYVSSTIVFYSYIPPWVPLFEAAQHLQVVADVLGVVGQTEGAWVHLFREHEAIRWLAHVTTWFQMVSIDMYRSS